MTFLLDTNVISELRHTRRRRSPAVLQWAASVPLERQYLSVVTLYELDLGVQTIERRDAHQGAALRTWFSGMRALFDERVLAVTERVALRCASLQVPDRMPAMDALIAATALENGLTLVTRNESDFLGRGVAVLNPWGSAG